MRKPAQAWKSEDGLPTHVRGSASKTLCARSQRTRTQAKLKGSLDTSKQKGAGDALTELPRAQSLGDVEALLSVSTSGQGRAGDEP